MQTIGKLFKRVQLIEKINLKLLKSRNIKFTKKKFNNYILLKLEIKK